MIISCQMHNLKTEVFHIICAKIFISVAHFDKRNIIQDLCFLNLPIVSHNLSPHYLLFKIWKKEINVVALKNENSLAKHIPPGLKGNISLKLNHLWHTYVYPCLVWWFKSMSIETASHCGQFSDLSNTFS